MQQTIYLDNNATTHLSPNVKKHLKRLIDEDPGNPESMHSGGISARVIIEEARLSIAESLNVQNNQVIFTSSGSESNSHIIGRLINSLIERERISIIASPLEHSSILHGIQYLQQNGASVRYPPVDRNGIVDLSWLSNAIREPIDMVFIQWANNETGVLQPIEEICQILTKNRVPLHVDAAQAYGRIPINLENTPVTSLTITAHKIHGPKGVAALISEATERSTTFIFGGQQENGLRGGTHNVIGIGAFNAAVVERFNQFEQSIMHMKALRDSFEQSIQNLIPDAIIIGIGAARVPNTSCITFPGVDGSALISALDNGGIQCSQGSACESRRPEPSHVLSAMGLSEEAAYSTLRFSFSVLNDVQEVESATAMISIEYEKLRRKMKYHSSSSISEVP